MRQYFQGRAGWNHSSYSGCFEPGHWGYNGVSQRILQYENADITVTNGLLEVILR